MTSIHSFSARALNGEPVDFKRYAGKVLLIVNTASRCGFTPQYAGLQKLYADYAARGFEVLAFPCNQFGHQEPGDAAQIGAFCRKHYGVTFTVFEKIDVNGTHAHPLYRYLRAARPGAFGLRAIKWNFTKFLVNRQGEVVKRYAPMTRPDAISADIEKLL